MEDKVVCEKCQCEGPVSQWQCQICKFIRPLGFPVKVCFVNARKVVGSKSPFVEYVMFVSVGFHQWYISRRYSSFYELNQKMLEFFKNPSGFPKLPPRSAGFTSGSAFNVEFLARRRNGLQAYINALVEYTAYLHAGPLCRWLLCDSLSRLLGQPSELLTLLKNSNAEKDARAAQLASHIANLNTKMADLQTTASKLEEKVTLQEDDLEMASVRVDTAEMDAEQMKQSAEATLQRSAAQALQIKELQRKLRAVEDELTSKDEAKEAQARQIELLAQRSENAENEMTLSRARANDAETRLREALSTNGDLGRQCLRLQESLEASRTET